jgi:DNA-binding NarL/FixJ family response regulator
LTKATAPRSAVLVDRHPLWLDAVAASLAQIDVRVVARASSLGGASGCLAKTWPDVVIGETTYDDDGDAGLRWVERVASEFPETKIVVLSAHTGEEHVAATLSRGAEVYVLKEAPVSDFVATVRQVFQRSVFFRAVTPSRRVEMPVPTAQALTRREVDILRLASDGHSNARISRILWVTEQTVKFHLSNVYRKIGVANRTEAGRWAQTHGILDSPTVANQDQPA